MDILITGGTGTFGHEIIKLLLQDYKNLVYDRIVVYSRDEQKQEQMAISRNRTILQ